MDQSSHLQSQMSLSRNVHDIKGLDNLRRAAQSGDEQALQEAAQQFEAIFVQMMLKSMRKAQDALADENSPFNSHQVKFYRDMHDQQLATDLSSKGSMGLAELIVQQLGPSKEGFTPASVIRNDADLSSLNRHTIKRRQAAEQKVLPEQTQASKQAAFHSPEDFVAKLLPQAQQAAEQLGLTPRALVAQAAVETGWGKFMIHDKQGNNSHNLFGIKADKSWQGQKTAVDTLEYQQGVAKREKAAFRSYASFAESMQDYVTFLQANPRYRQALSSTGNPGDYFHALQQAGYATDPKYADKVLSVLGSKLLQQQESNQRQPAGTGEAEL